MAEYIKLPDGSFLELGKGQTPLEGMMAAQRAFPDLFKEVTPEAQPQSGFMPAAKAGLSSLKSDITALAGRTGLMDEAAAEKAIQAEEEYRKRTFKQIGRAHV